MLKFLVCPICNEVILAQRNIFYKWARHIHTHGEKVSEELIQKANELTNKAYEDMLIECRS